MWTRAINTERVSVAALVSILFLLAGVVVNGPALEVEAQDTSADYFLKLDGIEGGSLDGEHRGEIDLLDYSWGMSNPTSIGSGGLSTGKAKHGQFTFTKYVDPATPELFLYSTRVKHIPSATITVRKDGHNLVRWELRDVVITSFKTDGDPASGIPTEEVGMKFVQIIVTHCAELRRDDHREQSRVGFGKGQGHLAPHPCRRDGTKTPRLAVAGYGSAKHQLLANR